jgi:hypothetical protein
MAPRASLSFLIMMQYQKKTWSAPFRWVKSRAKLATPYLFGNNIFLKIYSGKNIKKILLSSPFSKKLALRVMAIFISSWSSKKRKKNKLDFTSTHLRIQKRILKKNLPLLKTKYRLFSLKIEKKLRQRH